MSQPISIPGALEPKDMQDCGTNSEENLPSSSDANLKENTSLLDLINEFGRLPEFIVRSLFQQIIKQVSSLHEQNHSLGYTESLALDSNFNCIINTYAVCEDQSKDGATLDAVNLGILLFTMLKGEAPFANEEDPSFLAILEEDWVRFWELMEERAQSQNERLRFSPELRDFINRLLAGNYDVIQESAEVLWLNGLTISGKKVSEFLAEVRKKKTKMI